MGDVDLVFSTLIAGCMGLTAWFIWSRGVLDIIVYLAWGLVFGGVARLDLAIGGIDVGGFGMSSRYGGSFSAASMSALDSVYLLAAE